MKPPLSKSEIVRKLTEWRNHHSAVDEQLRRAAEPFGGIDYEVPLPKAVWRMFDAYTASVAESVGDESGWLDWFALECEWGRLALKANVCGQEFNVRNVRHLAKVIMLHHKACEMDRIKIEPKNTANKLGWKMGDVEHHYSAETLAKTTNQSENNA